MPVVMAELSWEKGIKFKECYQIGPTIGTHVGPETFGFIAVEKAKNQLINVGIAMTMKAIIKI